MTRRTVRQIGTIKKRRGGKYAIDVQREQDYTALLSVFLILRRQTTDFCKRRSYFLIMALFAEAVEDIQQDRNYLTQPIERKYLRFDDRRIEDSFTVHFRFRCVISKHGAILILTF